jgi:hypothetical protein
MNCTRLIIMITQFHEIELKDIYKYFEIFEMCNLRKT